MGKTSFSMFVVEFLFVIQSWFFFFSKTSISDDVKRKHSCRTSEQRHRVGEGAWSREVLISKKQCTEEENCGYNHTIVEKVNRMENNQNE